VALLFDRLVEFKTQLRTAPRPVKRLRVEMNHPLKAMPDCVHNPEGATDAEDVLRPGPLHAMLLYTRA
jgi:hypothetical protein